MANQVFNAFKKKIADGTLDWDTTAGFKVMLVDATNDADIDDEFIGSITTLGELSGTGYTGGFGGSGRKAIGTRAVNLDLPNDRAELDGDNITWTGINAGTIVKAIIVRENTTDADSDLVAMIDDGGLPLVTNGGDVTLTFNAEGILQLT
jgi:hypothetical protein